MFEPTFEQLARQLTIDKELGPRRSELAQTVQTIQTNHINKADELVQSVMEYQNEISISRCK